MSNLTLGSLFDGSGGVFLWEGFFPVLCGQTKNKHSDLCITQKYVNRLAIPAM